MLLLISYVIILVVFTGIDLVWLSSIGGPIYRTIMGDIVAADMRLAPAIVFYALYAAGMVFFVIDPAMKESSAVKAVTLGVLFGLFAYGTYDLTNYATLRNWNLQLTVMDMAWGSILTGVASYIAYQLTPVIGGWFGITANH